MFQLVKTCIVEHNVVPVASDTATVQRNISSKRHNICYEARLLSGKPRRVLCCISPKQLTLKDYLFKFIPKRITSFRLCPSTKVIIIMTLVFHRFFCYNLKTIFLELNVSSSIHHNFITQVENIEHYYERFDFYLFLTSYLLFSTA